MFYLDGNHIFLTKGDTAYMVINLKDAQGHAYTPDPGDALRFAVKTNYGAEQCVILKDISLTGETIQLKLMPDDTKDLKAISFVYDLELTTAAGDVTTVISDKLTLFEEVY